MRLKEDSDSWRANGLKAKLQPLPDVPLTKAKKDTKRWCKGVVGRNHAYEQAVPANKARLFADSRRILICKNCGKHDPSKVVYKQADGSYGECHDGES